jgi:hypothetical protein
MLIRKFKSNNPFLFVSLILLAIVLWIDGFLFYEQVSLDYENAAPLYIPIARLFDTYRFWSVLLSFLFLLLQAFMFNRIITDKNLVDRNSHLPGLVYIVLMSNSFTLFGLHPVLFANFFIILALDKIFEVYNEENVYLEVFNVGFLISMASLFYIPVVWYIVLVVSALLIYYLLNPRGILAAIIGFVTPYVFVALYYFWFDRLVEKMDEIWEFHKPLALFSMHFTLFAKLAIAVFGLVSLIAFVRIYLGPSLDKPVRIRNRFHVLLVHFILAAVSVFFASEYLQVHHAMIMLPLAAILAVYFQQSKKVFWNELLFSLLIMVILIGKLVRLD